MPDLLRLIISNLRAGRLRPMIKWSHRAPRRAGRHRLRKKILSILETLSGDETIVMLKG